jgi:hypothetical protein
MFTIPNEAAAGFADQAEPDSVDLDVLVAGLKGDGVVTGCAVTAQGTPDMTVAVAAGIVSIGGVLAAVSAGNVTIAAAHATNPRFDLIAVDNTGAKSRVAGTASSNPVFPAVPANSVILAAVYVPANDTTINSNQITDKRVEVRPGVIDRVTTALDVVNSAAETSFYSFSIPANLLSTNKGVRLMLVGDYLNDSGANRTVRLRVKLGATTLYDDTSGGIADGGVVRREFRLDIYLFNQGATNDQILHGSWPLSDPTAPAIGRGSQTSVGDLLAGPIGGDAAEDTTAAKTFEVTVQHDAANALVSLRRQLAVLELL